MHELLLVAWGMGGVEDRLGKAKSTSWRRVISNQPCRTKKPNLDQSQIPIVLP